MALDVENTMRQQHNSWRKFKHNLIMGRNSKQNKHTRKYQQHTTYHRAERDPQHCRRRVIGRPRTDERRTVIARKGGSAGRASTPTTNLQTENMKNEATLNQANNKATHNDEEQISSNLTSYGPNKEHAAFYSTKPHKHRSYNDSEITKAEK